MLSLFYLEHLVCFEYVFRDEAGTPREFLFYEVRVDDASRSAFAEKAASAFEKLV